MSAARTSKLSLACHLWFIIHHQLCTIPLASAQGIASLLPNNCLAAPCTYRGECRDRTGVCGNTVVYCNKDSLWVPGCGGGMNLDKPTAAHATAQAAHATAQATPPPTQPPTRRPLIRAPPTASPSTAWEAWTAARKPPPPVPIEDDEEDEDHILGMSTGQEGDGNNPMPSNDTSWAGFDANGWGYREEEGAEKEGLFDKGMNMIGFGEGDENGSAMRASKTELVFLWSMSLTWVILS